MMTAHISVIPEFVGKIKLQEDAGYIKPGCFDITKDAVVNRVTGSKVIFRGIHTTSGNQTANLKSIEGLTTFVLDEAEELDDENDFDTIDLSVRQKGKDNRIIIIMNPANISHWIHNRFFKSRKIPFDFNGRDGDTTYIFSCYTDHEDLLHESFLEAARRTKETNLAKYNHLFLGYWTDDAGRALWKRRHIQYKEPPQIVRTIVAVDPAVSSNTDSDETGIIVIGKGIDGYLYVLDDLSGKFTPAVWANRVVSAYERYRANCVVVESNQGGEMVKNTIHTVSQAVMVEMVHASVGKFTRAEPVFAYYEQNMVYHSRVFAELEFQMTTWQPEDKKSPDRMDALVWGVTHFIGGKAQGVVYFSGM
jgi:predicted phage terminase large subunit-like protein